MKNYPITIITVALIWYLCFFTPPSTKLDNVVGFDKVVHFGMYAFLETVAILEHWRYKRKNDKQNQAFKFCHQAILFVLMSGVIEILQETCTGGRRSGDIWDFMANSLGVVCALLIIPRIVKILQPK